MPSLPCPLYRFEQIRQLEQLASCQLGVPSDELMRRAGNEAFLQLRRRWPDANHIVAVCGSGNNGGDGFVVAALALQAGLDACVYSVCGIGQLHGDAQTACQDYLALGGLIVNFAENTAFSGDVLVDALFGTGLNRPVDGLYYQAIAAMNDCPAPVLAIDIPSGLAANTGQVLGIAVEADCTITFIGLKQGLFTGLAADHCGEIVCSALGLPESLPNQIPAAAMAIQHNPLPRRERCSHKGHFGHVLVIGGNIGYAGAALLAGTAALRTGAGLTSLATHPNHAAFIGLSRPELMCHGIENAQQLAPLLQKASVIVLGPGLGQDDWSETMFKTALACGKATIVDADALNLLAQHPQTKNNWILTPHPGEAARLLGKPTADIQEDRFAAAAQLQARFQGIAVLKGSGTLVASAEGIAVCPTGNPGMASGGMGDTLCGIIAGLAAQGLPLDEAAQQGVYLHGLAADLAASTEGERGLLASDLLPYLRQLMNK